MSMSNTSLKKYNNDNGFTLVEMVIAIALIVVISVAFVNFISVVSKARRAAQDKLKATNIAVDIMEEISSVQGTIWSDADDLQVWLTEIKGFTRGENDNTFIKVEEKYTIYLMIDKNYPVNQDGVTITGVFEVIVKVEYSKKMEISLVCVFREG